MKTNIILTVILAALFLSAGIYSDHQAKLDAVSQLPDNQVSLAKPAQSTLAETKPASPEKLLSGKLIIGNFEMPLIEVTQAPAEKGIKLEILTLDDKIKANLKEIVQQAQKLAISSATGATDKLVLKLSSGLVDYLSGGNQDLAALCRQISRVGIDIHGNPILQATSTINGGIAALGVMQVLNIVISQKYLADIDLRLDNIETNITAIQRWLDDEQVSKLTGSYKYLSNITTSIKNHEYTDTDISTFNNQLEAIERECTSIMLLYQMQLDTPLAKLKSADLDSWTSIGLKKHYEEMCTYIDEYQRDILPALFAIQVRAIASQLKGTLPVNRLVIMTRSQELTTELSNLKTNIELFKKIASARINDLKGSLFSNKANAEYRSKLQSYLNNTLLSINNNTKEITDVLNALQTKLSLQIEELKKPIEIYLTVNQNGEILEAKKVVK